MNQRKTIRKVIKGREKSFMNHKKAYIKSSVISLALMLVMLFSMSITAFAVNDISGLRQTGGSSVSVGVTWNAVPGAKGYNVYYSADGVNFVRVSADKDYDTSGASISISYLSAGSTYWVSVAAVDANYKEGTRSAAIQVVTAPDAVSSSSIAQTSATSKSISFTWSPVFGATGYWIYSSDDNTRLADVKTNAVTISAAAGSKNTYLVYAYRTSPSGFTLNSKSAQAFEFRAAPGKPLNLADTSEGYLAWKTGTSNKCTITWDRNDSGITPDGYQLEIYSLAGKKLKTYKISTGIFNSSESKTFNLSSVKNKGFQVRVCGYITIGGKNYCGTWTSKKVIIPQAAVKLTRKAGAKTAKVTWKKISNVTKYYVYTASASSSSDLAKKKFKKVATLKKTATSYTWKGLKKGKYYGIYIIPVVKVGSKTYKAAATWYSYTYAPK